MLKNECLNFQVPCQKQHNVLEHSAFLSIVIFNSLMKTLTLFNQYNTASVQNNRNFSLSLPSKQLLLCIKDLIICAIPLVAKLDLNSCLWFKDFWSHTGNDIEIIVSNLGVSRFKEPTHHKKSWQVVPCDQSASWNWSDNWYHGLSLQWICHRAIWYTEFYHFFLIEGKQLKWQFSAFRTWNQGYWRYSFQSSKSDNI